MVVMLFALPLIDICSWYCWNWEAQRVVNAIVAHRMPRSPSARTRHSTRAAGHFMTGTDKLSVDLPCAVNAQILRVCKTRICLSQSLVSQCPGGRDALFGCVVVLGAICTSASRRTRQIGSTPNARHSAIRSTVGVNVVHDHRDQRLPSGYLALRSSSAAAKQAALAWGSRSRVAAR